MDRHSEPDGHNVQAREASRQRLRTPVGDDGGQKQVEFKPRLGCFTGSWTSLVNDAAPVTPTWP